MFDFLAKIFNFFKNFKMWQFKKLKILARIFNFFNFFKVLDKMAGRLLPWPPWWPSDLVRPKSTHGPFAAQAWPHGTDFHCCIFCSGLMKYCYFLLLDRFQTIKVMNVAAGVARVMDFTCNIFVRRSNVILRIYGFS